MKKECSCGQPGFQMVHVRVRDQDGKKHILRMRKDRYDYIVNSVKKGKQ